MSKRIGIVTGGGDCPGLNAVIRAVAKAAAKRDWECVGILGGYEGLLEPCQTKPLDYQALSGLLTRGGTILGTANRGKFSTKVGHGESRALPKQLLDEVRAGMEALGLFALVCIGGDGTLSIAQQMFEHGVPAVGVPKTIDNDLEGTLLPLVSTPPSRAPRMRWIAFTLPLKATTASWFSKSWAVMPVGSPSTPA
jgi:ATP-dependent phosphofructokinase / diphosphate-dependent phosphofructokinase